MANTNSYYDWELNFRKSSKFNEDSDIEEYDKKEKPNKLGIRENSFKNFLKEWKKKNL